MSATEMMALAKWRISVQAAVFLQWQGRAQHAIRVSAKKNRNGHHHSHHNDAVNAMPCLTWQRSLVLPIVGSILIGFGTLSASSLAQNQILNGRDEVSLTAAQQRPSPRSPARPER